MNSYPLSLLDLLTRTVPARPWADGDNIPWNEPAFSERMLREHLSQAHDLASRRTSIVEAHAQYIHSDLLHARPTQVLDLACGPGLYAHRLARHGHRCVGIDFSPASIRHARSVAAEDALRCRFVHADVREADFGHGFGLVMMLYAQFNVFRRNEARDLVRRARAALAAGGRILLEIQTAASLREARGAAPTWSAAQQGLFSDAPYLELHERFWDESSSCSTDRWYIIDLARGAVTRYALSCVAYSSEDLLQLLRDEGFRDVEVLPHLEGSAADSPLFAITALV